MHKIFGFLIPPSRFKCGFAVRWIASTFLDRARIPVVVSIVSPVLLHAELVPFNSSEKNAKGRSEGGRGSFLSIDHSV